MKRPMKVREWRATSYDRSIRLEDAHSKAPTRPVLHTEITIGTSHDDIIEGRVMSSASGMLAEVTMQVTEAVVGFKIGGQTRLYRDLRASDPGMSSRRREFGTTGVILRITEDWFAGGSGAPAAVRAALAEALAEMLIREKSIAPHDLDHASTRIALYERGVPRKVTDTIVLYDAVYGGLRLTEPLFAEFDEFVERLRIAARRAGEGAFIDAPTVERLNRWFNDLQPGLVAGEGELAAPEGELLIYAPGSRVCARVNGMLQERVLVEPHLEMVFGQPTLFYRYEVAGDGKAYVQHDNIEPTGHEWRKVFWNPESGVITDPEDGAF
jgi:DEAD/DEAH box helicase domain-containing protein